MPTIEPVRPVTLAEIREALDHPLSALERAATGGVTS